MKITRNQLRSVIKETMVRQHTNSYLINEGILSFLGDLFMGMVNFALAPFGIQVAIGEEISQEEADKLMAQAKSQGTAPAGVESVEDLQPAENTEHRKWLIAAQAPTWVRLLNQADDDLAKAGGVTNWTPADETDAAQEAWKKEQGENAEGLWAGIGVIAGMGAFLAKQGLTMPDSSKAGEEAVKTGNPAEAINFAIKTIDAYSAWWKGEGAIVAGSKEVIGSLDATKVKLAELAKAVTGDAKEEQAEQKNENRNRSRKIRVTRSTLRKVIKGANLK